MAEHDKKKTVVYKDAGIIGLVFFPLLILVANAVKSDPRLEFLTPLIPQTMSVAKALELKKNLTKKIAQEMPAAESDEDPDVSTINLQ